VSEQTILEGNTLSTETIESQVTAGETTTADSQAIEQSHEGHNQNGHDHHGHRHEGHDHAAHDHEGHNHGPALNPECTREVEITVPAEVVSKAFRKLTKRYQQQARIPGFRAGKVPESLIRSRFGDSLRQDVLEQVMPVPFREAIDAQGLKPVSQPQVVDMRMEDGEPLYFKAMFEVLPEIQVDGYQDVKVEKPDTNLTEEEFQAELERARDSRSTMEPVNEERALADGDWAQISFKGQVQAAEGEAEAAKLDEPLEAEDVNLEVGGKNTLEAFNNVLRGATVGQPLKFEVTYPADFGEPRLAGKTVAYDVDIKGIKKKIQPELNDDFAKELGDYESFEDFSTKLREHLAGQKKQQGETATRDKLMDALTAKFNFPVPESLVQQQIDVRLDRGLRALAAQGMNPDDMRKLDFQRLRGAQHTAAVAEVKGMLLLDKIAEAENVEVTDEEINRETEILALQMREPVDDLRARLTQDGSIARIREQLRREKVGKLLYERL
jgi:trigger factor